MPKKGACRPLEERFWEKVDKSGECWEWTKRRNACGYGTFGIGNKSVLAHRVAYEMTYGKIPSGMNCLHRCDNPSCVNPKHLWIGTQADNVRDCENKGRGRHYKGSMHGRAKLTEQDIPKIFELSWLGVPSIEIAKRFGVSDSNIDMCLKRKTWRHVYIGK